MTAFSKEYIAEVKRLQALEDRRRLVRAAVTIQEVFAQHLRQGQMILLTTAGEHRRCAFLRPGITRLVLQVRCGLLSEADLRVPPSRWFRKGHPARSKARQKFKGVVTSANDCRRKPARGRACQA